MSCGISVKPTKLQNAQLDLFSYMEMVIFTFTPHDIGRIGNYTADQSVLDALNIWGVCVTSMVALAPAIW